MPHANAPLSVEGRRREQIESWRRELKWSAQRITDEPVSIDFVIDRRTVSRHLTRLGLGKRRFIDPDGENNRKPGRLLPAGTDTWCTWM